MEKKIEFKSSNGYMTGTGKWMAEKAVHDYLHNGLPYREAKERIDEAGEPAWINTLNWMAGRVDLP